MEIVFFFLFFLLGGGMGWLVCGYQKKIHIQELALEKRGMEEKLDLMEKMHSSFLNQFKGISSEALKQNNETFLQIAEHSLEKKSLAIHALMKPVKETLEKFDGKIQELEKIRTHAYATLKEQLQSMAETQKELRVETSNLVRALRTPHVRGRWGEIQLKRVVEMAGMLEHCDFFEQTSITSDERRYRPDLLVKLPGNKNIIVDAKAPLEAYLEAIECQDDEKRRLKFKDHAQQIRTHMTQLSRKSYWEQFQHTPEFVVLFLPGEPFFSAALEHDPTLIEAGVEQKVILATPTTLIALLRAVSYGWRQENLSRNAEQIRMMGKELYKRLADMGGHFGKVGKSLSSAVTAYNRAVGSMESRVLVSARRFTELAGEQDIEPLEPVDEIARLIEAPEFKEDPLLDSLQALEESKIDPSVEEKIKKKRK